MSVRPGKTRVTRCIALLVIHICPSCCAVAPSTKSADSPFVHQTWRIYTTDDGLPHNHIRAIHVSGERIWVGTERGLALRHGGVWKRWPMEDVVAYPVITAIAEDPQTADLWLGTWGSGLVRFSAGRFDEFNQLNSGLAGNLIFAAAVMGGRVWVATNAGVNSYDPNSDAWNLYLERRADTPEVLITNLCLAGNTLVGSAWCGGLWRYGSQQDEWVHVAEVGKYTRPKPISSNKVDDTTVDIAIAGQTRWWATQTELLRRVGDRAWESRTIHLDNPHDGFVHGVASSGRSGACLATDSGLEVLADWDTDTWVSYRRCPGGAEGMVTVTRNGPVIGSSRTRTPIPDNRIRCVASQGKDIWVGTANGLALGTELKRWDGPRPSGTDDGPVVETTCVTALPEPPLRQTVDGPHDTPSIGIGVLGPRNRAVAIPGVSERRRFGLGQPDLLAVQIAVRQANASGGYRNKAPFEVSVALYGYANYAWGTPEDEYPTFAYGQQVRGLVGHFDPGNRIETAVALGTEVPVVSASRMPPTVDEIVNPWIFRCFGDEPRQQRMLLDYVLDHLGHKRIAVLRTPGGLTDIRLDWWVSHARKREHPVAADLRFDPHLDDIDPALEALQHSGAEAVFTWCDIQTSALILKRMREAGMTQLFVGSDGIVENELVELVGTNPGPVIAAYPITDRARRKLLGDFAKEYAERNYVGTTKRPPGPDAYFAYDATRHLLEAINVAGPNREAIRRTLTAMSHDANGERHFEESHSPGPSMFARLQGGRWTFHPLPEQ